MMYLATDSFRVKDSFLHDENDTHKTSQPATAAFVDTGRVQVTSGRDADTLVGIENDGHLMYNKDSEHDNETQPYFLPSGNGTTTLSPTSVQMSKHQFYQQRVETISTNSVLSKDIPFNQNVKLRGSRQQFNAHRGTNHSSLQHHSVNLASNPMVMAQNTQMSLKGRLQEAIRLQSANVQYQNQHMQLTKQELLELRKMNANREINTLLDKTKSKNNHLKYLTGGSRLMSAVGLKSGHKRNKSGSNSSMRSGGSRVRSAHSRAGSNSQEQQQIIMNKLGKTQLSKTRMQSLKLLQSYGSVRGSNSKGFNTKMQLNFEEIAEKPRNFRKNMTSVTKNMRQARGNSSGDEDSQSINLALSHNTGQLSIQNPLMYGSVNQLISSEPQHLGIIRAEQDYMTQKPVTCYRKRIKSAQSIGRKKRIGYGRNKQISGEFINKVQNAKDILPQIQDPKSHFNQTQTFSMDQQFLGEASRQKPGKERQIVEEANHNREEAEALQILRSYPVKGKLYTNKGPQINTIDAVPRSQDPYLIHTGLNSAASSAMNRGNFTQTFLSQTQDTSKLKKQSGLDSIERQTGFESIPNYNQLQGSLQNSTLTNQQPYGQVMSKEMNIEASMTQQSIYTQDLNATEQYARMHPGSALNTQQVNDQRQFSITQDPVTEPEIYVPAETELSPEIHPNAHIRFAKPSTNRILLNEQSSVTSKREEQETELSAQKFRHQQSKISKNWDQRVSQPVQMSGSSTINDPELPQLQGQSGFTRKVVSGRNGRNVHSGYKTVGPPESSGYKKVQEVYQTGTNGARNTKVSPMKAPQYKITDMKNQILAMQKRTQMMRGEVEKLDNQHKRTKNEAKRLREQALQCEADKLEVMRDLSQYEFNYSRHPEGRVPPKSRQPSIQWSTGAGAGGLSKLVESPGGQEGAIVPPGGFRAKIGALLARVKEARLDCLKNVRFDEEGDPYLTGRSHQYEFMGKNYDELLGQGSGERQQARDKLRPQSYLGGQTSTQVQPELMNIRDQGAVPAEPQPGQTWPVEGLQHESRPLKRWLKEGEMDHLRGCLKQLAKIKNGRKGTPRPLGDLSLDLITASVTTPNTSGRSSPQVIIKNDTASSATCGQPTGGEESASQAERDEEIMQRSTATRRKGYDPVNIIFLAQNSWEDRVVLQDPAKIVGHSSDETRAFRKYLSGLPCKVVACLRNGVIEGQVCCSITSQSYKFELVPTRPRDRLAELELSTELNRLSLDYVLTEPGNYQFRLSVSMAESAEELAKEQKYIVAITGCSDPLSSVVLTPLDDQDKIKVDIHQWHMQPTHNPDVTTPARVVHSEAIDFKRIRDYLGAHYGRPSEYDPLEIASYISREMCVLAKANHEPALMSRREARDYHTQVIQPQLLAKFIITLKKGQLQPAGAQGGAPLSMVTPYNFDTMKGSAFPGTPHVRVRQGKHKSALPEMEQVHRSHGSSAQAKAKLVIGVMSQEEARRSTGLGQLEVSLSVHMIIEKSNESLEQHPEEPGIVSVASSKEQTAEKKPPVIITEEDAPGEDEPEIIEVQEGQNEAENIEPKPLERSSTKSQIARGRSWLLEGGSQPGRNKSDERIAQASDSLANIDQLVPYNTYDQWELLDEANEKGRDSKHEYGLDHDTMEQLRRLRLDRFQAESVDPAYGEDDEFTKYEHLYGVRLAKAHKRYLLVTQAREHEEAFEQEKRETQVETAGKFMGLLYQQPLVFQKNRKNQQKDTKPRRKYFRQPKIYQNGYLMELCAEQAVIEIAHTADTEDLSCAIIHLFFKEQNQICLLLGREDSAAMTATQTLMSLMGQGEVIKGTLSRGADGEEEEPDEESDASSQGHHPAEKDDDSPFFVKIILDSAFLQLLEDANLVEPAEIIGPPHKIQDIMNNKTFQEIVNREVLQMFYRGKQAQPLGQQPGAASPLNSFRLVGSASPRGVLELIDKEVSRDKKTDEEQERVVQMYDIINEESSVDRSNNPNSPKHLGSIGSNPLNENLNLKVVKQNSSAMLRETELFPKTVGQSQNISVIDQKARRMTVLESPTATPSKQILKMRSQSINSPLPQDAQDVTSSSRRSGTHNIIPQEMVTISDVVELEKNSSLPLNSHGPESPKYLGQIPVQFFNRSIEASPGGAIMTAGQLDLLAQKEAAFTTAMNQLIRGEKEVDEERAPNDYPNCYSLILNQAN